MLDAEMGKRLGFENSDGRKQLWQQLKRLWNKDNLSDYVYVTLQNTKTAMKGNPFMAVLCFIYPLTAPTTKLF